jgi:uncharacterized YigZ family protein
VDKNEVMMTSDVYKTIDSPSTGLYKEKGSKFIAYAYPVSTEEEIKDILAHIRKEHHSARHHCFAWILNPETEDYRMNDDGEPSGTAGRPIYNQLKSFGLVNILVVVVRYFGGILLGTSGLTNAYKQAAQDALNNAPIVEKMIEQLIEVRFDYSAMNDYMRIIKEMQLKQVKSDFSLNCFALLAVRKSIVEQVLAKMNEIEHLKASVAGK